MLKGLKLFLVALLNVCLWSETYSLGVERGSKDEITSLGIGIVYYWLGSEISHLESLPKTLQSIKDYQRLGIRVRTMVGLSPYLVRRFISSDRKIHPEAYDGKRSILIIVGNRASFFSEQEATLRRSKVNPNFLNSWEGSTQVRKEELIVAFLDSVGERTKVQVVMADCIEGVPCTTIQTFNSAYFSRLEKVFHPTVVPLGSNFLKSLFSGYRW